MKKKLPFEEELFQHAEIADIDGRENHSAASLMYFIDTYQCMFPEGKFDRFLFFNCF